jgi:molecular chaperone DnaK
MSKVLLGIDLGTTNTVCCRFDNTLDFLKFKGKELLPSVLYYRDGKTIVGDSARKKAITYPDNVIMSSKTYMGDDDKTWTLQEKVFTPTEVAENILKEVVKEAKKAYNADECAAVITVPAYFTSKQYRETEKAAEAAGLEVIEILPEPMAASIAYGMDENENQKIFVIDLGGGTFDVSILSIEGNEFKTINVDGDRKLGGDDFDQVLVELCLRQIRRDTGMNLSSPEKSGLDEKLYQKIMRKLQFECEKAKVELSAMEETEIIIPSLIPRDNGTINFQLKITRDEFVDRSEELLDRIEGIIKKCLNDADCSVSDIDKVILVGGSSNILAVRSMVQRIFDQSPYADKDLSKLVAIGAAIKATGDKTLIKDKVIVVKNILSHSFGVRVVNDRFSIILPKGTEYPCKLSDNYTTVSDYQTTICVKIYEGEDTEDISNDYYYDEYDHNDIEECRAGIPQIEITFDFDKNRVLHVSSKDLKTGKVYNKDVKVH